MSIKQLERWMWVIAVIMALAMLGGVSGRIASYLVALTVVLGFVAMNIVIVVYLRKKNETWDRILKGMALLLLSSGVIGAIGLFVSKFIFR